MNNKYLEGKEVEECQSSELACPVAKTAERWDSRLRVNPVGMAPGYFAKNAKAL